MHDIDPGLLSLASTVCIWPSIEFSVPCWCRRPYRLLNTLKNDKSKRFAATLAAGNSVTANYVDALPAQRPALRNTSMNVFDKNLAISELYRAGCAAKAGLEGGNSGNQAVDSAAPSHLNNNNMSNINSNSNSNNMTLFKSSGQSPFETLKKLNSEREMLSSLWLTARASDCFPNETYHSNPLPSIAEIIHHSNILPNNGGSASCMPLGMCFATAPQQHKIPPGHCEALVQLHMRQCFGQHQPDNTNDLLAREMMAINGLTGLHLLASASMQCSQQQTASPPQQMVQQQQQHNSAQLPAIKSCNMTADNRALLVQSMRFAPIAPAHSTTACE
jgi:hypothetical protein